MWNFEGPLEVLNEIEPTEANVERIQSVIDIDKYVISEQTGFDLCGDYAPFCKNCDKTAEYPCARAYLNMKNANNNVSENAQSNLKIKIRIAVAKKRK